MSNPFYFLIGNNRAIEEVKAMDWAATPLGPAEGWPLALKTTVQLILNSHFPIAITWGPDKITIFNDAFRPILGAKHDCMGKPFNVIWEEAWSEIGAIADRAYAGEATFIEDFPLVINRSGTPEQCYFTFCYSPIAGDDGEVAGMMDTVIETTGKVEAEAYAAVVNAELVHRMKNAFAVVQSLARQTFRGSQDEETIRTFEQRVSALAGANDALMFGRNATGSLSEIIGGVARALAVDPRMSLAGPSVMVGPKGALHISLLAHELATNAIKYGSLKNPDGQVDVTWSILATETGDELRMEWRERGGPPVSPPTRTGFGTKLIRMGMLGTGRVETFFDPSGFRAEIAASMHDLQSDGRLI